MPPYYYNFTPAEIKAARTFGQLRKESKDAIRKKKLFEGRDHIHDETVGVLGEAGVGKFLHLRLDTSINITGDGGVDFRYHGMTIDAKSTEYQRGVLIYDSREKFRADIAIFAVVEYKDRGEDGTLLPFEQQRAMVRLCGWIRRQEFMARCQEKDMGHGLRVVVPQNQLNPMDTFPLHTNN